MNQNFLIPNFYFVVLLPFIAIALTGIVGLLILLIQPKSDSKLMVRMTLIGLVIATVASLGLFGNDYLVGEEMVTKMNPGMIGELLILICTFVVVLVSKPFFDREKIHCPEFYPLVIWSALGGMIMCSTENLLTMFVGLELLSISLYVLAGINKRSKFSQEAAMKYFLLGAFATGFFLYGIAFLYGATGSLDLDAFKMYQVHMNGDNRLMFGFSFALIMVGLCFKCGLAPFHQWIPDVYSGAPTNVVSFMATAAKIGPLIALYNVAIASVMLRELVFPICITISVISTVVGNILAFNQKDVKRILAYSSIVNAGYLLIFIAGLARYQTSRSWDYGYFLVGYVFATLGVFVILGLIGKDDQSPITLLSLRGLSKRNPGLAALLVVFVLSQIGIGPVAGFLGKALIVTDFIKLDQPWLAIILLANSAFAAFYYFKVVKAAYERSDGNEESTIVCGNAKTALAICTFGVIGTVIFYGPIYNFLVIH
jgi:NADH-quinone oxidoreductase subunit N